MVEQTCSLSVWTKTLVAFMFLVWPQLNQRQIISRQLSITSSWYTYYVISSNTVLMLRIYISFYFILPKLVCCSYAIASRKSYSYILQFTVCLGQLYGCIVYFATAYLDGFNFWASPFYFWAYFIGANSSWVVIPLLIARRSWKKICVAIHQAEKVKTK
jgi:hypothetical protein